MSLKGAKKWLKTVFRHSFINFCAHGLAQSLGFVSNIRDNESLMLLRYFLINIRRSAFTHFICLCFVFFASVLSLLTFCPRSHFVFYTCVLSFLLAFCLFPCILTFLLALKWQNASKNIKTSPKKSNAI